MRLPNKSELRLGVVYGAAIGTICAAGYAALVAAADYSIQAKLMRMNAQMMCPDPLTCLSKRPTQKALPVKISKLNLD